LAIVVAQVEEVTWNGSIIAACISTPNEFIEELIKQIFEAAVAASAGRAWARGIFDRRRG
jgi:hypothetical protein